MEIEESYIKPEQVTDNESLLETNRAPSSAFEDLGLYEYGKLSDEDKKPPEFIVDGMIPVGMTFLSGAPKIRKSFMALQLAIAVATGSDFLGHKTVKCSAAYFDLEGSTSRTASRVDNMKIEMPENLFVTHKINVKIGDTLVEKIRRLHQETPDIRLVIIDTYSRARGTIKTNGANAYDSDVTTLEPIQRMAIDENISILFVHHDKKGAGLVSDSFERLSGTMGISGSADSILNLIADGKRHDGKARLEYTPRDALSGEMELLFNDSCLEWQVAENKTNNILENPIIKWCIENAPDDTAAATFFRYEDVSKAVYTRSDNTGSLIRSEISSNRNTMYLDYGVAVQVGVKSHGERGIRLMRVS